MNRSKPLPKIAWFLGYAGLIPFFILTVFLLLDISLPLPSFEAVLVPPGSDHQGLGLAHWLGIYAAVILSFLGAIHWGVVMGMQESLNNQQINRMMIYSVIPSILGWITMLLPIKIGLTILGILILLAYLADYLLLFDKIQPDYARLRKHLSLVVSILLFTSAVNI